MEFTKREISLLRSAIATAFNEGLVGGRTGNKEDETTLSAVSDRLQDAYFKCISPEVLRNAAIWCSSNPVGTPVPEWVSKSINSYKDFTEADEAEMIAWEESQLPKTEEVVLDEATLVKRYNNACATYYGCTGHKKSDRNMESIEWYKAEANRRNIPLLPEPQAAKCGTFNGEGSS